MSATGSKTYQPSHSNTSNNVHFSGPPASLQNVGTNMHNNDKEFLLKKITNLQDTNTKLRNRVNSLESRTRNLEDFKSMVTGILKNNFPDDWRLITLKRQPAIANCTAADLELLAKKAKEQEDEDEKEKAAAAKAAAASKSAANPYEKLYNELLQKTLSSGKDGMRIETEEKGSGDK